MRHIYGTLYKPVRVYCAACGTDDHFTFYRDRFADSEDKDDDLIYYEYGTDYKKKFKERFKKAIRIHKNENKKAFWADDICLNITQLQEFYTFLIEDQLKDFLTEDILQQIEDYSFNPQILKDEEDYEVLLFKSKSGFIFSYFCFDKMLDTKLDFVHSEFSFGWLTSELISEDLKNQKHKNWKKFKIYWNYIFKNRNYYFDAHCAYLEKNEVIKLLKVLSFITKNQDNFHIILRDLCKGLQ